MSAALEWLQVLRQNVRAGVAHMFTLSMNIADLVYRIDTPAPAPGTPADTTHVRFVGLRHTLQHVLLRDRQLVIFYDPAAGITFGGTSTLGEHRAPAQRPAGAEGEAYEEGYVARKAEDRRGKMEDLFRQIMQLNAQEELPRDPAVVLPLLERALTVDQDEVRHITGDKQLAFPQGSVAVVIGYAETVAPAGDIGKLPPAERAAIVRLARWSRSKVIAECKNLVILLTLTEADLSEHLRNDAAGVVHIAIPLPSQEQRAAFIAARAPEVQAHVAEGTTPDELARAAAGLPLRRIEELLRLSAIQKRPVDVQWVWEQKKRVIDRTSRGLLEVARPIWTFEHVGGLDGVKQYLREVAAAIREGRTIQVPQGILFTGPPGTGKTIMAEALATGLGFPMLRIKNTKDMWVGASERNMEFTLSLIEALAPVVVFEDEMDTANLARGSTYHGDSGVSAGLMGRKLAFMSDSRHRGRILWIGATNRPDLMDAAMLRPGRFDTSIPFLLPGPHERAGILAALMRKLAHQARIDSACDVAWELTPEDIAAFAPRLSIEDDGNAPLGGYSGAEMEVVCTRAVQFAARSGHVQPPAAPGGRATVVVTPADIARASEDFIPARNVVEYTLMTLLAIQACNSNELLPAGYRRQRVQKDMRAQFEEIQELRVALGGSTIAGQA